MFVSESSVSFVYALGENSNLFNNYFNSAEEYITDNRNCAVDALLGMIYPVSLLSGIRVSFVPKSLVQTYPFLPHVE